MTLMLPEAFTTSGMEDGFILKTGPIYNAGATISDCVVPHIPLGGERQYFEGWRAEMCSHVISLSL